jgi:copper homeostasis protein CutC
MLGPSWLDQPEAGPENSTMKGNPEHKIEAIVDALIESDQVESTVRYLTSGRRFASLETEEIKKRWTQAARTFLMSCGGVNPGEMDDLGSELGLRKVALPCEDVSVGTAAVARRIRRDDDLEGHARILERIRKFRDDLERPRN